MRTSIDNRLCNNTCASTDKYSTVHYNVQHEIKIAYSISISVFTMTDDPGLYASHLHLAEPHAKVNVPGWQSLQLELIGPSEYLPGGHS